jgi:hypothetical protein
MSGPRVDVARKQRGAITWVTLLLVVAVVVAGYLSWVWAPIYYENFAVKQVVRDFMNQAVKNRNDEQLRRYMVDKIRSISMVQVVDGSGRPARVPAIPLEERDVTWERDASAQPPVLHVAFDYAREVDLPFLDRTATKVFTVDLSNDLTIPDWGSTR